MAINENNAAALSSGNPDAVVNPKSETNSAQSPQTSSATKNTTEKGEINDSSQDKASWGDVATNVGLSLIPVYGTIREFQKGNIGWGIFGAVTDALTLIGVGYAAKALSSAVRGGTAAIEAARGTLAITEAGRGAATITEAARGAETVAEVAHGATTAAEVVQGTEKLAEAVQRAETIVRSGDGLIQTGTGVAQTGGKIPLNPALDVMKNDIAIEKEKLVRLQQLIQKLHAN